MRHKSLRDNLASNEVMIGSVKLSFSEQQLAQIAARQKQTPLLGLRQDRLNARLELINNFLRLLFAWLREFHMADVLGKLMVVSVFETSDTAIVDF